MSFYLIAETAFHHEGDKNYLLKLIDAASQAGSDSIKFQILIDLDEFMSSRHSTYETAKNWVLSREEWKEVLDYTVNKELDIIAMPLDRKAFDVLKGYKIKYLEIHSVSFKDDLLFECLDNTESDLIFGVGGRTKEEIDIVVEKYNDRKIVLMVGFQSFPTVFKDSQISKVATLKELYPQCEIGYTDHSAFDDEMAIKSSEYAYVFGARVFEKHLTLDEGMERIDFQSAIGLQKFLLIKKNLAILSGALENSDAFSLSEKELIYRNRQKLPVANKDIPVGKIISVDDLSLKMIDKENVIESLDFIVGKKVCKNIARNEAFLEEDLM